MERVSAQRVTVLLLHVGVIGGFVWPDPGEEQVTILGRVDHRVISELALVAVPKPMRGNGSNVLIVIVSSITQRWAPFFAPCSPPTV